MNSLEQRRQEREPTDCAYCDHRADSPGELIDHLVDEHDLFTKATRGELLNV